MTDAIVIGAGAGGLVARRLRARPAGFFASPAYLARRGTPKRAAEFAGHRPQAVGDTLRAGIAAAAQDAQFGAEFRHHGRRPTQSAPTPASWP